ncbi:MAG: acyl--CoA ligase [Acidimicrobiales bacterium]|nr:acyl--CoA ligase [Acidimicrobiales bacterium]
MTLASVVPEAARRFGELTAFVAPGGWRLTYAELDRLADEVAAGLAARGLDEGDLLALVLPSTPDYVVAYAAAAKLGAITAGINPRYTPAERAAVLQVAQPRVVISTKALAEGIADGSITSDPIVEFVQLANQSDEILCELRDPSLSSPPPLTDPADPERLVAVVFTSGTTGTPKGAMFGNRELAAIAAVDLGPRAGVWGGGGPTIANTQFAHVGFMTKLPWYLQAGHTTYILERWRAKEVLRLVHEHRMPTIGGVATQVALMLRDPDFDRYDFSCVKAIIMGGALSPPALVHEARERFGAAYSIRYSSTESGGVGTATAYDADDDEALFTVGRPRGETELEIRDDDDQPLPVGETGEICIRSPYMFRGYWRDPDTTAETLRNGWLHTGDLGYVDERGLLHIAGRRKEMYIRGGYNVYPIEVESVLASHPGVSDVAVVPRPDPVMGEIGVAVVVPKDPTNPPSLESLRAHAADRLATYKLPEALRIVSELPLTAMHKIDRRLLAELEARHRPT